MKEWLSEQVWGGWLREGGERRRKKKSQFGEHGEDERYHHCEFNEGKFGKQSTAYKLC